MSIESLIEKALDDVPWPMAQPSKGILLSRLSLSGSTSDLGPHRGAPNSPVYFEHHIPPCYPDPRDTLFLQRWKS
ncbi:hypothetical protein [Brucella pseudogrignonensis]|uniref:Uncharacterized protein n=1 Tax=Brucella pseudogrignonensis TaxID=419475 RepID=A0ABU1MCK6_9HYPH|nr:hypothetical protein [Brucella pseudogrignonensis]MDR6433779.1 hypothetical protein [Brucella pseudogrignonensis]